MSWTRVSTALWKRFRSREYRHAYVESLLDSSLASQIQALREQRKLTQSQLAALTGMKQPRVSALEDVNYSSWSIKTLKRLARALDVVLVVRFESFGKTLERVENWSESDLLVPSFDEEVLTLEIENLRSLPPVRSAVHSASVNLVGAQLATSEAIPPNTSVVRTEDEGLFYTSTANQTHLSAA